MAEVSKNPQTTKLSDFAQQGSGDFCEDCICLTPFCNHKQIGENPKKKLNNYKSACEKISLEDTSKLLEAKSFVKDDISIILNVCSTGQDGKNQKENMANCFRQIFSKAMKNSILSLTDLGIIEDIQFSNIQVEVIFVTREDGMATIPAYQANNN